MSPEHQQHAQEWSEKIRQRIANPLARTALWAAEQVGKRVSFDNDYPDEDYDDAPIY
jgi:hypothetical protein